MTIDCVFCKKIQYNLFYGLDYTGLLIISVFMITVHTCEIQKILLDNFQLIHD